jgi:hypothetical protein
VSAKAIVFQFLAKYLKIIALVPGCLGIHCPAATGCIHRKHVELLQNWVPSKNFVYHWALYLIKKLFLYFCHCGIPRGIFSDWVQRCLLQVARLNSTRDIGWQFFYFYLFLNIFVANAFISTFNTQTMHIKSFWTQQHCYVSLKTLYPGGIRTRVFSFQRRMRCPLRHAAVFYSICFCF